MSESFFNRDLTKEHNLLSLDLTKFNQPQPGSSAFDFKNPSTTSKRQVC